MGSHKGGKGVAAEAIREVRLLWLMSRAATWMLVSKLIQVTTHPRRPIVSAIRTKEGSLGACCLTPPNGWRSQTVGVENPPHFPKASQQVCHPPQPSPGRSVLGSVVFSFSLHQNRDFRIARMYVPHVFLSPVPYGARSLANCRSLSMCGAIPRQNLFTRRSNFFCASPCEATRAHACGAAAFCCGGSQ